MRRLSWPSRKQRDEEGFTLIELMVAMVIITTVLLVLAATTYTAFGSIGFSRQRDTATELANQAMEQIKAMNFSDLAMSLGDVQADTANVTCSGSPVGCTFNGRTIPTVSLGSLPSAPNPLDPHIVTTTPALNSTTAGQSAYTVSSYITFDPSGNTQARVATVKVVWTHPVGGAKPLVQIESTIFATGALAAGTGHLWSAQALDSAGTIALSGSLLNVPLANLSFGPGSASAGIGVNGTATATGNVAASTLQLAGFTLLSTGQSTAGPATSTSGQTGVTQVGPNNVSGNTTLSQAPANILTALLQLVGGGLTVTPPVGVDSTTEAIAASSANGSSNLSGGTMPSSSLPYAQGLSSQSGPVSLGLNLTLAGLPLLSIPIISITPLGNNKPDLATVCQQSTTGCVAGLPTTGASQTSLAGPAIVAQGQKSFAEISVLPQSSPPLLDITGFTAAASAAAGPGFSNTGKTNLTAATITLLNTSFTVAGLLTPITRITNVAAGLLGNLGVTATLNFGTGSTSGNSAVVASPMTLTVALSLPGVVSVSLTINLGQVSATASYS